MPRRITASFPRAIAGVLLHGTGLLMLIIGLLSGLLAAVMVLQAGSHATAQEFVAAFIVLVVLVAIGLVGVAIGSRLQLLGRRIYQPTAQEVLAGGEPFILFLRSFDLDRYHYSTVDVPEWFSKLDVRAEIPLTWFYEHGIAEPAEAPIVAAFNEFYPVIAVGRPGELLPALGAARLYFRDDEWQTSVTDLISRARLILLAVGKTPGLDWELSTIVRTGALSKLAVYVPVDPGHRQFLDENWRAFRALMGRLAGVEPETFPPRFATEALVLVAPVHVIRSEDFRPSQRPGFTIEERARRVQGPNRRAERRAMACAALKQTAETEAAAQVPVQDCIG